MPPRPRRVLGYARVSSSEQAIGTSLDDQQAAITAYAETRGLSIAHMFVEAESAVHEKIERREQMRLLLADVREGDLVLCHRLDRWSRDAEFSYRTIREILAAGASFFSVEERCDPATSEGDTALGFRILFAREEHKRIKLRTVGTRRLLRDRGYYVEGLPPYGYARQDTKGIQRNVLRPVPDEAETVRRVFAMCIAGRPISKIADAVGVKRDLVHDILRRRVYMGEIQNTSGAWIRAQHEPIIAPDVFARAREAVDGRRLIGRRERPEGAETATWLLRDVVRCALCHGPMSAAYAGTPEARRHYYRCYRKCTPRHVRVDAVERVVADMIAERLVELRDELSREPERPSETRPSTNWAAKLEKNASRRARTLEAHADGHMTREELRTRMAALESERLTIEAKAAHDAPSPLAKPEVRAEALRDLRQLQRAWRGGKPVVRREIATHLLVSVLIAADREPLPAWRSATDLAAEST